jgi:hypothetical protein
MARRTTRAADPRHIAVRATFVSAGDKSASASNTFYFRWSATGTPVATDWAAAMTAVQHFYTASPTGTSLKVQQFLGRQISGATNASELATYEIDTTDIHHAFGSPVSVQPFTVAVGAAGPWPQESAIALSFRAAYGTDPEHDGTTRPRASDRGRVYIGPLDRSAGVAVLTPIGTYMTVADPGVTDLLAKAAKALFAAAQTAGWIWSIWSRKQGVFKDVADYAVNDDFDSQRRRSSGQALQNWVSILAP